MAGEREQVTRTDVAEAVRAMASFPWKEMLDVQRETAQALRGIREARARPDGGGADGEEAFPTRAAIAAANSRAEIVTGLEDVSAMVVSTRTAVYECSGRLASCAAVPGRPSYWPSRPCCAGSGSGALSCRSCFS